MGRSMARVPLERVKRLQIYINEGRKDLDQIRAETGADYIINGGLYDMARQKANCHLKADGHVYAKDPYSYWGYAWDTGQDIALTLVPAADKANYICCSCLLLEGRPQKLIYDAAMGGARPRTAMGLKDGALMLFCGSDGMTPEGLRDYLQGQGWESAVMLDGGGSSQCWFNGAAAVRSSRKVHNLILVYITDVKEEDKPVGKKYKVCLDPGHGVETAGKCSPDKSYYEHEFALDMARRVKALLERHGVEVVLTRTDQHCPTGKADTNDLNHRVKVSNSAGADLFVSLHSNAQNGTGWGTVQGYGIYTSAGPETAARNVAARKLLARARAAGVPIWGGGLFHDIDLIVTRKTNAPAVLIEHGFHTHREETELLKSGAYRDKLAQVDAKGILDFLGVAWEEEEAPAGQWGDAEVAKAVAKGVIQGDEHGVVYADEPITLRQWCVLADRLGLLK